MTTLSDLCEVITDALSTNRGIDSYDVHEVDGAIEVWVEADGRTFKVTVEEGDEH